MATTNHIYTAEDMQHYFSGKMNAAEMHVMEKAALNDPLLADAMEGYHSLPGENFVSVQKQLDELKNKISGKTISIKKYNNKWWKVAAAILLLVGSVFAFYKMNNSENKEDNNIAKQQAVVPAAQLKNVADSVAKQNDSLIANNMASPKIDSTIAIVTIKPGKAYAEKNIELKKSNQQADDSTGSLAMVEAKQENNSSLKKELNESDKSYSFNYKKRAVTFSGKVTDENNNAIPFAKLIINNDQQTKTDAKGVFNLSLPDSVIRLDVAAQNYFPATVSITANGFASIVLTTKKTSIKKSVLSDSMHRSLVQVLYKRGVEPKGGWDKYILYLIDQLSNSQYDDGRIVHGETIVRFEIDRDLQPTNFSFEKQIDEDVNNAIENLILIGPEWRIVENGGIPGIVEIKIIF